MNKLKQIDLLIRSGEGQKAKLALSQLLQEAPRREDLPEIASLLRRNGEFLRAAKVLSHLMVGQGPEKYDPTAQERSEYAASLNFLGASHEAREILKKIDPAEYPKKLLFEAFAAMAEWETGDVINILNSYRSTKGLTPYEHLVCDMNLVAALIHEGKHEEAGSLIAPLLTETEKLNLTLLRGNILELSAVNDILNNKWEEAKHRLDQAEVFLKDSLSIDSFFVRKWRAIAEVLRTKADPRSVDRLQKARSEAQSLKHWETLRDFDRYLAIARQDESLLHRVYFGTPFENFRKKLLLRFGKPIVIPTRYHWQLHENEKSEIIDFDSLKGIKRGELFHRLLMVLAEDFYRPRTLAVLHAKLYPGQYFNAISAPKQIYTAIYRLRLILEKKKVPFSIEEESGAYQLRAVRPATVVLYSPGAEKNKPSLILNSLRNRFSSQSFSANDAAKVLSLSSRSALRVLTLGVEEGSVTKVGTGPVTRYQFTNRKAA